MWDELLRIAAANGLWALLFVSLLVYQLQDSRKRETKYQEIISSLTKSLTTVEIINDNVSDVKDMIIKKNIR